MLNYNMILEEFVFAIKKQHGIIDIWPIDISQLKNPHPLIYWSGKFTIYSYIWNLIKKTYSSRGHHCCERMVVGFTTTYAISAYHHWSYEFESRSGQGVQHYVIKFVSFLRQVGGFLRLLRFPPPIKLTATI